MRCKNCGWPNEDGAARCVKCNAPLLGSATNSTQGSPTNNFRNDAEALKATLREPGDSGRDNDGISEHSQHCPKCGYPMGLEMRECPVCHTQVHTVTPDSNNRIHSPAKNDVPRSSLRTINPWATPTNDSFCTLRRIPWQNECVTYEPVTYSGEEIVLNRANTDSNNQSITSREHAVISCEDNEWYIENRSELQTTLIRVDRKHKLEDGDVIVLGNRMFEFRKG